MSLRLSVWPFRRNRLLVCFVVSAIISSLLLPPTLLPASTRISAMPRIQQTFSGSAPTQPFSVNGGSEGMSFAASLAAGAVSQIGSFLDLQKNSAQSVLNRAQAHHLNLLGTFTSLIGLFIPSMAETASVPPPPIATSCGPSVDITFDFDCDGKADIGRWRSVGKEITVKNSTNGWSSAFSFAWSTGKAAPGDFDGDGRTDPAVFNSGTWAYRASASGNAYLTCSIGTSGDIPVPGDYNGDGTTDFAIYRPSTGEWKIDAGCTGSPTTVTFGVSTDIPVPGDFDGDSKTDIAVWRPSDGYWHIAKSTGGFMYQQWGMAIDVPVIGDFDGDGLNDPTVFRPTNGMWFVMQSGGNYQTYQYQSWGNFADQPVAADYDGDGITDIAIWRPTTTEWWIRKSSDSTSYAEVFGALGDLALPSAFTKQVGGSVTPDERAASRLAPRNSTGGTDMYSQNFGWSRSLVSLPGRSGLDLDLGISYNSLVWTKIGSAMFFDLDNSTAEMTPGFRLGLPVIEPVYFDPVKNVFSYMMVGSDGSRTEFRQHGAGGLYRSADSNYMQLSVEQVYPYDPPEIISMSLRSIDGSLMSFAWKDGAFRCTSIRDRNGNYITFTYSGRFLSTVTDTLGRVITIDYDEFLPTSITQTWKSDNGAGSNETHTWATFSYVNKTVATNFSVDVYGPLNGTVVKVLDKVTYADGSSTKFDYNGYLQVQKVSNVAADSASHVLNWVSTNLDAVSGGQNDCPRFTQTKTWAENFNNGIYVTVDNTAPASDTFVGPNGSETTKSVRIEVLDHPNDLYSLIHFAPSGYKEGLTLASEDCIGTDSECGTRKRWTWTDWTQDNTTVSYRVNPRVIETRVGDGTNTKKTSISYYNHTGTGVRLPETISIGDLTTVLKTQKTLYNWASSYTSRRIIGLPLETTLWEGEPDQPTGLMSKVTYAYDQGTLTGTDPVQNISPTQHLTSSFGPNFNVGRGNLTSVTRHDVAGVTSSVTSSIKYNTAGSPVSKTTPWDGTNTRTVKMEYADSFNSTGHPATFAYPTKIYDPAGNFSTVKYRYDIGANIEATSPAPAGQSVGKTTKRVFDSDGRLERDSVYVGSTEKAYSRYEYPTNGVQSKVFSMLVDINSNGPDSADEVLNESWTDGMGRVRMSRLPHTFDGGSTASWVGTLTEYDLLGRVQRQSVPTEMDSEWEPDGDDELRDWLWTQYEYDWMGRATRTINTDGTDTLVSYEGCGCAGGSVAVSEGELVPIPGTQNFARRKQKSYSDVLGRTFKFESFEWDGSTVYSTT